MRARHPTPRASAVALWTSGLLAAAAACGSDGALPLGDTLAEDARYRLTAETTSPSAPDIPGELRLRLETKEGWHIAPEAPATLRLESPPGVEIDPESQGASDARRLSQDALEFAAALRASRAGASKARGQVKFGICRGPKERCHIVRREVEVPLAIAFR